MNPVAKRRIEPAAADFLGPAEVVEVQGDEVVVELRGGEPARAALALAAPYEPVAGDVLLVIGKDGEHYAIGVLRGSGKTALRVQGDLERFKDFIEERGAPTGAWRGKVENPSER